MEPDDVSALEARVRAAFENFEDHIDALLTVVLDVLDTVGRP